MLRIPAVVASAAVMEEGKELYHAVISPVFPGKEQARVVDLHPVIPPVDTIPIKDILAPDLLDKTFSVTDGC